MIIKSIQKVIKVGDSLAVTIPAKAIKFLNIKPGDYVSMTISGSKDPQLKAKITIQPLSKDEAKLKQPRNRNSRGVIQNLSQKALNYLLVSTVHHLVLL